MRFRKSYFGAAYGFVEGGGGGGGAPPPQNLSHISYKEETWRSYTLPKANPKTI